MSTQPPKLLTFCAFCALCGANLFLESYNLLPSAARRSSLSSENPVIHLGEEIVAPFDLGELRLVDLSAFELFGEGVEATDVRAEAAGSIFDSRALINLKGPVARLREQEFARCLVERAAD